MVAATTRRLENNNNEHFSFETVGRPTLVFFATYVHEISIYICIFRYDTVNSSTRRPTFRVGIYMGYRLDSIIAASPTKL